MGAVDRGRDGQRTAESDPLDTSITPAGDEWLVGEAIRKQLRLRSGCSFGLMGRDKAMTPRNTEFVL